MSEIRANDLGQTWLALLQAVYQHGEVVGQEARELRNVCVAFEQDGCQDEHLFSLADHQTVEEMRKVFFSCQPNRFGHSYAAKLRGPCGRKDLSDVTELLAQEPATKRAAVTLVGDGDGKVPCINVVHFLRRDEGLYVSYFARGQDVFRKFYADSSCLHEMGRRVAEPLGIPVKGVSGLISSAHIYLTDLGEVETLLAKAKAKPKGKDAKCSPAGRRKTRP